MVSYRSVACLIAALFAFGGLNAADDKPVSNAAKTDQQASAAPVDFDKQVQPILARHCVKCHGPAKQESGLRVDSVAAMLKGGYAGPAIEPGKSGESRLLLAIAGKNDLSEMPPEGPKPSADEVAILAKWIDAGAKGGAAQVAANGEPKKSEHWSYQPVRRPTPPAVKNAAWACNPIDQFVLAKIEAAGLVPSPEADPAVLCRRVYLDLTGLPPSPEEVAEFVASYYLSPYPLISPSATDKEIRSGGEKEREEAYAALVDKLLASPHYGERWGRHWLDGARYADSNGYTIDSGRSIWKYRDWVIDALNADMPFDQFTIEQIAGDMLPKATQDQQIATGFHRNTLVNEEGGTDKEQFRVEAVVDRVSTVGTLWLGLTVGCARCHDHKYDAISQREFYQLFALLNNCEEPSLQFPTEHQSKEEPALLAEIAQIKKRYDDVLINSPARQQEWESVVRAEIAELQKAGTSPETLDVLDEFIKALDTPVDKRTDEQKKLVADKFAKNDVELVAITNSLNEVNAKYKQLKAKITTTLVVREMPKPRESYIHIRGDFLRKGTTVEPGTLAVLPALKPATARATRLDLARWLVDEANPLTPRVTMNRVWQQYFGTGLVATENDFGTQGDRPTHPELLDWLAAEFMARGWSLKQMHRLIVTSATYRQSSAIRPGALEKDPYNKLLARQSRVRLEAETIRDEALAACGLLTRDVGGPGVYPPQPEGIYAFTQQRKFWPATTGPDRYRRGMYTYFWRSSPYPFLMTFDAPDANAACTRRVRSNTPLQALTLANDRAFIEMAQSLADRVLRESPSNDVAKRADYAFRLCLARAPQPAEVDRLAQFVAAQQRAFEADANQAAALTASIVATGDAAASEGAVSNPPSEAVDVEASAERAAWTAAARVLLNLDEFITRE